MMTASPVETLAAVEKMIGDLLTDIGANVCVTCRGRNLWTISGKPGQVKKAVGYLVREGIMRQEDESRDEDGEVYAYLVSEDQ